jgi:hypothetical protein
MSENSGNPFKQTLDPASGNGDPFAPKTANPFGAFPNPAPSSLDLGSRPDAQNPFESPAALPAEPEPRGGQMA